MVHVIVRNLLVVEYLNDFVCNECVTQDPCYIEYVVCRPCQ